MNYFDATAPVLSCQVKTHIAAARQPRPLFIPPLIPLHYTEPNCLRRGRSRIFSVDIASEGQALLHPPTPTGPQSPRSPPATHTNQMPDA
jgi:hypothetical protein